MKKSVLVAALAAVFFAVPAHAGITIAIQPTSTPEKLEAEAKGLEARLEKELGTDVNILFPTDYAGVVEALNFGHADAAFMGAWPASLAVKRAGATVELAEIREVSSRDGRAEQPYYYSYWVVREDSPWNTLADLRGRAVAFPNPLSTSGYVAPLARLADEGLVQKVGGVADPKTFFGNVLFAGGYAQAAEVLRSGQVDAALIAGDVPARLFDEVIASTRVIAEQGPIPSHVVVFSRDFKGILRAQLKDSLLRMGDEEGRSLMRRFVSGIFVRFEAAGEEHLAALDRMLESTGLEYEEKK